MAEQTLAPYDANQVSYDMNQTENPRPELSAEPIDKRPIIIGLIVAIVLLLIFIGIGWWLFVNPVATAILRDIFIIFMGLGIFLIILLLIMLIVITAYLVIKVNDLVQLLDREIKPMLARASETLGTVRGTTSFISEQAVKPIVSTASTFAATKAIFRNLFRR